MATRYCLFIMLAAVMAPFLGASAAENDVRLEGEPVDILCYFGGKSGGEHADCAKSCVEKGLPIGFVTKDDDGKKQMYLVMGADEKPAKDYMAKYMGEMVLSEGKVVDKDGLKILTVSRTIVISTESVVPSVTTGAEDSVEVSLTGEPVDVQCYLKGRSGEAHASCAKTCAEKDLPIGFATVDDDGKEHLYLVMGADQKPAKGIMLEHMGKEVTATGTLATKNGMKILTVSKVEAVEEDDDWFPSEGVGSGSIQNQ